MNFNVNQVRHLYVANAAKDAVSASGEAYDSLTDIGDAAFPSQTGLDGDIWLYYRNASGSLIRSDLVKVKNITRATVTGSSKIAYTCKGVQISLDGDPVEGVEYILGLNFRQYVGLSEQDQLYVAASMKAFNSLSASALYAELAVRLAANISGNVNTLCKIELSDGTEVDGTTKLEDLDGTYTYLTIYEVGQDWHPGRMAQGVIPFTVATPAVVSGKLTVAKWGEYTLVEGDTLPEGQKIVDLEIFTMGERGDQYHQTDWPSSIPVQFLAQPGSLYDVIDIHYYSDGPEGQGQRSEKDLQIACLAADAETHTVAKTLVSQLSNLGVTVTTNYD